MQLAWVYCQQQLLPWSWWFSKSLLFLLDHNNLQSLKFYLPQAWHWGLTTISIHRKSPLHNLFIWNQPYKSLLNQIKWWSIRVSALIETRFPHTLLLLLLKFNPYLQTIQRIQQYSNKEPLEKEKKMLRTKLVSPCLRWRAKLQYIR